MRNKINLSLISFLILSLFTLSECKRNNDNQTFNYENFNIKNTNCCECDSNIVISMIKLSNIDSIITTDTTNKYLIYLHNSMMLNIKLDERNKKVSISDIDSTRIYTLSFFENAILLTEKINNDSIMYNIIDGISEDVPLIIKTAVTTILYNQTFGNVNYQTQMSEMAAQSEAYICIHPRRSWCNRERMISSIEEYCGQAPSMIGGTDCGCAWGDFLCICITEFEC